MQFKSRQPHNTIWNTRVFSRKKCSIFYLKYILNMLKCNYTVINKHNHQFFSYNMSHVVWYFFLSNGISFIKKIKTQTCCIIPIIIDINKSIT